MQMSGNKNKIITITLFLILFVLSLVGIWKTIYFSADIDESYALTMAYRIAVGDRMMVDMWEPHQMSAALYAPLVALYKGITGSMEGALVFMRICGVLIQGGVSVFLYRTIRKYMPHMLSMVLSFAYFNFTPKHIQSPEFTVIFYWAIMVLMLVLLRFFDTGKERWMIPAGLSMSAIVLCYPPAVLLFVYVACLLLVKGRRKKACLWFTATCVSCGVLFVLYLMIAGGGWEIFSNIPYILKDESHAQSLRELLAGHLQSLWNMLGVLFAMMVLCHVGRPVFLKKKGADRFFFGLLLLFAGCYSLYQFHTIQEVNFTIFYPVVLQLFVVECYAYFTFPQDETDRIWFAVSMPLNLLGVLVILFTSNVLTEYSMSFFMPSVILGAKYIYGVYSPGMDEGTGDKKRSYVWMAILLCICIVAQIFATRILLVRFTSTRKKNIFETYYEVNHDVLKGVRLGDLDYVQYDVKSGLLKKYISDGDVFLYVGSDMFLYTQSDEMEIGTGNTISTPAFAGQLMDYYEKNPDKIPNIVFVDREYGADFSQLLTQEPMKSFMETYFDAENAIAEAAVTVYQRER